MTNTFQFQNLSKIQKVVLFSLVFLGALTFSGGRAHAASLTVSGSCSLDQSLKSVDNASNVGGCVSTGAYGTNDTINIPAGTQTLSGDLTGITVPVVIQGAGMSQTTIDGAGLYTVLDTEYPLTVKNLKITAWKGSAIYTKSSSVTLDHVEVDGAGVTPGSGGGMQGIAVQGPSAGGVATVTADSVFVHNITNTNDVVGGFSIDLGGSATTNMTVNLTNTTVSNIHNTGGGVNAFIISAGAYSLTAGGTLNANIDNTTVDEITASDTAAGFGSVGFAGIGGIGHNVTLHTIIRNATVTGIRGSSSIYINKSPALFSAAVAASGADTATVIEEVENSLIANNQTDGTPTNCFSGDLSASFGGSGGTANGSITSNGHNLSDDGTCTSFTGNGDRQNLSNIIPTLGALQDNGGPVPTRALLAGSPAIGAGGQVLGISTDARGIARSASSWDVGAYQSVLGASTSGSSGGSLGNTGQNTKTGLMVGIFMISSALTLVITKRKSKV